MTNYIIGDIHDEILKIESNSIDFIYTNPPFATTKKEWDNPLRWKFLFPEMWRVLKPDGCIAIHTAIPFTYDIIRIEKPRYNYIWKKKNPTCPMLSKIQPLRNIEEILIFYKKQPTYNPQIRGNQINNNIRRNNYKNGYYGKQIPNKSTHRGRYPTTYLGEYTRIIQKVTPKSINDEITIQMIKTYTNENDTILDMTCCSKNNGDICRELNRKYIGIDISDEFII